MAVRRPVPDAQWVAPGIFSIPIPIEGSDLPYVLVYAVSGGDEVLLVDAGWAGEQSLRRLEAGLEQMGSWLADVTGVIVTHVHSDHYGLAGRIRQSSGAWIGMHADDVGQAEMRYRTADSLGHELDPWLRACGVPAADVAGMRDSKMWPAGEVGVVPIDRLLHDGDVVHAGERAITVIHTPGHSPGHIVLRMPDEGVIFTGDHVLPHITPNVSAGPFGSADPLGDYLASLEQLQGLGPMLALPAHGWTFADLGERIDVLREHHRGRLAETTDCLAADSLTTFEVAHRLKWSRPLDQYPLFLQRAALGETEAHLVRLAATGQVKREGDSPAGWRVIAGQAA